MAKARKNPTRGGGSRKARSKDGGFEVEEQDGLDDGAADNGAGLESALVFVTFLALVIGLIVSQMDLSSSFGKGMLG